MKGFRLLAGLLLAAALLSGCYYAAPEVAKPPPSPVGTYRQDTYRVAGFETNAEGVQVPKFERTHRLTVRIAADHSMTYEWTRELEPTSARGRLDASWREATAEERSAVEYPISKWWVFERGDPDRKRGAHDTSRTLMWMTDGWWVPSVDFETGRLMDSYFMVRRADD